MQPSLEHYGVLGMSWGKRNGPPYPLERNSDGSISSAQKKKASAASTSSRQSVDSNASENKKSGTAKKVVIAAGVTTAALLAAYGLKKASSTDLIKNVKNGSKAVQKVGKEVFDVKYKDAIRAERQNAFKNRRSLSMEELQSRIKRLETEKKFRDLASDDLNQGRAVVRDVLKTAGPQAAKIMTSGAILYAAKVGMTQKFDWKEAADYIAPKPKKK